MLQSRVLIWWPVVHMHISQSLTQAQSSDQLSTAAWQFSVSGIPCVILIFACIDDRVVQWPVLTVLMMVTDTRLPMRGRSVALLIRHHECITKPRSVPRRQVHVTEHAFSCASRA